jgi:hypothetical protein
LGVEGLETRDLPTSLTWIGGPTLPTARGGVVAVDQGNAIAILGGGAADVPSVGVTDPIWQATVATYVPLDDPVSISPGIGVLPTGSVLLFGGHKDGGAVPDALQYNPGLGGQALAPLNTAREFLGYATDQHGNVYAIGGLDANGTPLASVEYYIQSSKAWTFAAALPQALYAESAAYDGNGHLFTFGGVGADGSITGNVYEYTIATNTWSQAASMPLAVRDSAAVLGSNNLIYVLGGDTSGGTTAAVESYNPATNTWSTEATLPDPVRSEAVVNDALGRIEVLGGYDSSGNPVAGVWVSQRLNVPDTAPAITSSPLTAALTINPYTYQVFSTANPQATYALTSSPTGMTIDPNTGLLSWTPTPAQPGTYTVTVQASNRAGQTSQTYNLTVRQAPPTVPTGLTVTGVDYSSITLSWNASTSPIGISAYDIYHLYATGHSGRGGGITVHHDIVGSTASPSFTVSGLLAGTVYTYDIKSIDTGGTASGYSGSITGTTLADKVAPTLTVPANQSIQATSTSGAPDPAAFSATATDPGPGIDSVTIFYAVSSLPITSGYVFPAGTTTVNVMASDRYGNSVTGSFTVTVVDSFPQLTLPANQLVEQTGAAGSTDPAAFTATATDAVDTIASITYAVGATVIDSTYVFVPGTTTVTVTATDTSGLSSSGTFTVTVADTPPTLSLSGLPVGNTVTAGTAVNLTASGTAGTPAEIAAELTFAWGVSETRNGATTVQVASGSGSGSSTPIAFTASDAGTYTVSVTATDVNGASTMTSQTITATAATPAASLQFTSGQLTVAENAGSVQVTVIRGGDSSAAITVAVVVRGGTAVPGVDFTFTPLTLQWAAGDSSPKSFAIPILNDGMADGNQTIVLGLQDPTGGATPGDPSTVTVTIEETNTPPPTISPPVQPPTQPPPGSPLQGNGHHSKWPHHGLGPHHGHGPRHMHKP